MASEIIKYRDVVEAIKTTILQAQHAAAKSANAKQLQLYYAVGGYISIDTRNGAWGTGALKAISEQLQRELPGLRGFSESSLKYMRIFFEQWSSSLGADSLDDSPVAAGESGASDLSSIRQLQLTNCANLDLNEFCSIGFTHHRVILSNAKTLEERLFYIHKCANEHLSVGSLKRSLKSDDFHRQGAAPNNFLETLPRSQQALRAITTLKDGYAAIAWVVSKATKLAARGACASLTARPSARGRLLPSLRACPVPPETIMSRRGRAPAAAPLPRLPG